MQILQGLLIAGLGVALLAGGCTTESRSGNVYTRDQARTGHTVQYGTILKIAPVTIEGTQTGAGTLAGGARVIDAGAVQVIDFKWNGFDFKLTIDSQTGRIAQYSLSDGARTVEGKYSAFDAAATIEAP